MKNILIALLFVFNTTLLFGTEQTPDNLNFKGKKLSLSTGWGHPSPLETYYSQNNIPYPFEMISTGNYRGHVATWEISDSLFFLKELQTIEGKVKPELYSIKSKNESLNSKNKILADWFSGVVIGEQRSKLNSWEIEKSYYFYIKNGKIIDIQEFTEKDFKKIEKLSEKDTSNREIMAKYSMLYLNNNYISYYFRLNGKDSILLNNKSGYLTGNHGLSPIMILFSNDHLKWPYNWENFEKSGAPFCTWNIKNDSIVLTNIELQTGTGFYSIDKIPIQLNELFENKTENIFAYWISGIYIIQHGENVEDEFMSDYYEFKANELTYLRTSEGIIKEMYTIPADFDFINIPEGTEPGLKQILNELKN